MLKPDMRMIWANSGDVVTPPESKVDLGWILEKPPSQYFNWHLNRTDRMLVHINRRGIPSWSSDTEYHTDGIASYVVGSNGRVYVSVAPSGNNTSPAKDPTTDTTREFWKPAFVGWDEAIPESQITGLTTKLNSKVDKTQRVNTSNGLSGGGALSGDLTIRPTYGTTANTVTQGNDPRLSNSREWSAATVGEAEAKAGTATTRRAWTAQRVHQAADGWHDKKFSTIVKNILSRSNAQQIRNDLQLGTAATRDVGTGVGDVLENGAYGFGRSSSYNHSGEILGSGFYSWSSGDREEVDGIPDGISRNGAMMLNLPWQHGDHHRVQLWAQHNRDNYYFRRKISGVLQTPVEILHTENIRSSTGNSTSYPMTQAATTAALNQKVSNTTSIIAGTGLEGGGTLSQNRTLSVKYGTTAGTAVEGNDSRVVNALQKGNNLNDLPNKTLARQYLGLGSAATRDVVTSEVDVSGGNKVVTQGWMGLGAKIGDSSRRVTPEQEITTGFWATGDSSNRHLGMRESYCNVLAMDYREQGDYTSIQQSITSGALVLSGIRDGEQIPPRAVLDTRNILSSTGNSTSFPMTQAATTAALNQKVSNTTSIIAGTGLEGGGTLSQSRTLSVKYGTTAGTAVEGNDSRVVNALQKGSNLSDVPNKTLARQYLGLGTAATRNVGTSSGNLMEVGAFGLGGQGATYDYSDNDVNSLGGGFFRDGNYSTIVSRRSDQTGVEFSGEYNSDSFYARRFRVNDGGWLPRVELLHTGNIRTSTGNSTSFPMTQAAVTSALNTKADTSYVDTELDKKATVGTGGTQVRTNSQLDSRYIQGGSVVQATGTSTTNVMSQKAVTDSLANVESSVTNKMLGVGQTWQDVTGSRSLDTTYTNNTGRAIMVVQVSEYFNGSDPLEVFVDNVNIMSVDQGNGPDWLGPVSFVVPNGSSYRIEKKYNPNIASWVELR